MRPSGRQALLLVLLAICTGAYAGRGRLARRRDHWVPRLMELSDEEAMGTLYAEESRLVADACKQTGDCTVSCILPDLEVAVFKSTDYSTCQRPNEWTITVNASSEDAVIRLRLDSSSVLMVNESLTVLEADGNTTLAVLTESKESWVANPSAALTLVYLQEEDPTSQIQVTLVAYNQTQNNHSETEALSGVLEARDQVDWTGKDWTDYASNTEQYWHLDLLEVATHINFTVTSVDLDPEAGDVLIIGAGKGPYDSEPVSHLLTGKYSNRKYHVAAGEAFVYFLSSVHAQPRNPFQVSYDAGGIVGTTTPAPTTTDRDHPPTPADVDFQLDCFITGIEPSRFLDPADPATDQLRYTLASWAGVYKNDHKIPVWRDVSQDDIQFSAWMMCDYASGWVIHDPNCVRVTWFIELLRTDGGWAFLQSDLRGIVQENGAGINNDLGYQFSLTLDEVNENWWWVITYALVPIALLVFAAVMWLSSRTVTKVRRDFDENASLPDLDKVNIDEHGNEIDNEVTTMREKDKELRKVFQGEDQFQEYDPELQGASRRRGQYVHLSKRPLKPALKAPKPTTTTYTNAAFEGDDEDPDRVGGAGVTAGSGGGKGKRGSGSGSGSGGSDSSPEVVRRTPRSPAPAAAAAPLMAEPASSELTEQLRLLNEINKTLKEDEKKAGGIELPRVDRLVTPLTPAQSKMYSMNDDGTGTEVDIVRPGDSILQLEDGDGGNRKSSHV